MTTAGMVSKLARALVCAVVLAGVWDVTRPPERQLGSRVAIAGVHVYRATLARAFGASGLQCRFEPSCSRYGEVVLRRYGLARGGWMAFRRVLRCGPWTPLGAQDPPPAGA